MSIVCVGSVALDSVKTPSGERKEVLGGAATYFATAASIFTHVDIVAVVGEDFPKQHVDFLASKGVGLEGLERRPGRTFRWTGEYGFDLNEARTLETQLNVFESFRPTIPAGLRATEWLFLGNIDPRLQLEVLDQVEKPKLVAADTMNYWIAGSREPLEKLLARIDLLFVNDSEARQLSGQSNIVRAARAIQAMGPRVVCIKRGEYGALLFLPHGPSIRDGEHVLALPSVPLAEVQDPTRAGDSFAGGFLGSLAAGGKIEAHALRRAAVFGTVLASFTVERFGLERLGALTRAEVEDRFRIFSRLTWQGSLDLAGGGGLDKPGASGHA